MTIFERIDRRERNINSVFATIMRLTKGESFDDLSGGFRTPVDAEEQAQLTELLGIIASKTDKAEQLEFLVQLKAYMHHYEQKKVSVEKFETAFGLTPCGYVQPIGGE